MKHEPKTDLETYFKLGEAWDQELYGKLRARTKLAYAVAGVLALCCIAEAFALMALAPLKTTQAYAFFVDKSNGYLEEVRPLDRGAISQIEAVVEAELVRYVNAREIFDPVDYQNMAEQVRVTSAQEVFKDFIAILQQRTEKLQSSDRRFVDIKSVQVGAAGPETAFVRYSTRTSLRGDENQREHWIATIAYKHEGLPLNNRERLKNPLGFVVTSYRVDRESISKE